MNLRFTCPIALCTLGLVSLVTGGCDPGSEEIGATVGDTGSTEDSGEPSSEGTADTGDSSGEIADGCLSGAPLVSGTVTREMTKFTWNEPFVPSPEAHIRMSLGDFIVDGDTTVVAEHDVPFEMLPFTYVICGDPDTAFTGEGLHVVSVDVFNHEGTDGRVGDLIDEYLDEVDGVTEDFDILVGGLEHCDDPNAGGFCTTEE